jgi:hypothetical protein
MPAQPLSEEQRKEVFLALVDAQDHDMGVAQSRRHIAVRYDLSEKDVRSIEREGLDRIIQALRRKATAQEHSTRLSRNSGLDRPRGHTAPLPPRGMHSNGLPNGSAGAGGDGSREGAAQAFAHAAIPIKVRPA